MSASFIQYIRIFLIRTVVSLVFILLAVTIVRATTVVLAIRKASARQTYNERLVRNWSPAYPQLHQALLTIEGPSDTPRTHVQPSILEKVLLSGPDFLMNIVLQQTRPLWYPRDLPQQIAGTSSTTTNQSIATMPPPQTSPQATATRPSTESPASGTDDQPSAIAPPTPSPTPAVAGGPEPEPVAPQPTYDPDAMWATVVNPETPIYNLAGMQQERIPAGSVMDIKEQKDSSNGALFVGTVYSPIGRFDQIAIRAQDLQIYRGKTLHDTTLAERERASEKGRILGAIVAQKEAIEDAATNRNPHQAEYRQMLRRYQALREEAQQLKITYDKRTGSERIAIGNRLREIQQAMANLTPAIHSLKEKRDRWNATNPQTAAADPEQDPRIITLRRQLSALENN